jgi:hypothetical protein
MQIRSTNTDGATHFGGSVVAGHNSSHGVEIFGGSTGGSITPIGDDANISLTVRAKGTGVLAIGDSSNTVQFAGSTSPFAGMVRVVSTAVATPNFNSTGSMGLISTITIAGVNSSHLVLANPTNLSTGTLLTDVFAGSTAGSVNLKWNKYSTTTIAASTATIRFLIFRF